MSGALLLKHTADPNEVDVGVSVGVGVKVGVLVAVRVGV